MNTFAKNYLKDFLIEGSNKTDLFKNLNAFSDHTEILLIHPEDLIVKSIESIKKEGLNILDIKPEYCSARDLFPLKREKTVYSDGKNYHLLTHEQMIKAGMDDSMIAELKEIGYFFMYEGKIIIPDSRFFPALCRQLGVSKLPNEADPMRELFVAYMLGCSGDFKMVVRHNGKISRCLTTFSKKHHDFKQNEIFEKILEKFEDKFQSAVVSYFCITQNTTSIRIAIKEKTLIENVNERRKRIEPSIILNYSDTGDVALSASGYISINGRGFYVGEPISSPGWNTLDDLEKIIEDFSKKIIPEMDDVLRRISMVKEDICVFSTEMIKVLDSIKLEAAVGASLYDIICKNASDKKCTKKELLFDILDTAGLINKVCLLSKNKEVPLYAVRNCERKIGSIFTSPKCKGVFGW